MEHRTKIIRGVLELVDEANYNPCGSNWSRLNELVDSAGGVFGNLASWIVVVGSEWTELQYKNGSVIQGDRYADLCDHLPRLAASMLGLDPWEWELLEFLPLESVREELTKLASQSSGGAEAA